MAGYYTKLDHGIVGSTVWQTPNGTRLVWITMLALCDQHGYVGASIPGLASIARVTFEECQEAIRCFLAPDPWSRTKDYEGRRIAEVDGGWVLLNHAKYKANQDKEAKRERSRLAMARLRDSRKQQLADVSKVTPVYPISLDVDVDNKAPKATVRQVAPVAEEYQGTDDFKRFWKAYPNKKKKKEAIRTWDKRKLDSRVEELIAHVAMMLLKDDDWKRGYVPMGATYLNGDRWQDEPKAAPSGARSSTAQTMDYLDELTQ